jgi:hypothetical protein
LKYFLLLIFYLFATLESSAEENNKYYEPRSSLPLDMRLALSHLQFHYHQPEEIKRNIIILDQFLDLLSEEERLFITKAELYKALFRITRDVSIRIELFDQQTLDIVTRARQESTGLKETHPFFYQLYGSILGDLKPIIESPGYRTFVGKIRTSPSQLTNEELILKRKMEMVLPWIEWFQKGGVDQVNSYLVEAFNDYLNVIISRMNDYFFLTRDENLTLSTTRDGDLSFFTLKDLPAGLNPKPVQEDTDSENLETILAPILKQQDSLPKPVDDWRPRESAQDFFKMAPDPNYVAPEALPDPVNDWIQGL